ncbi:hypothetical protein ACPV54_10735 [Vibrio mediterranei]
MNIVRPINLAALVLSLNVYGRAQKEATYWSLLMAAFNQLELNYDN